MRYPHLTKHRTRKFVSLILIGLLTFLTLSGLTATTSVKAKGRVTRATVKSKQQESPSLVTNNYRQTNLVSDLPGVSQIQDALLVNPWGITLTATSPFWVSNNVSSTSTLYRGDVGGVPLSKNISFPGITIPGQSPTGVVASSSSDFVISAPPPAVASGPARFIFASLSGNISGWNPNVPGGSTAAIIARSLPGHVYTGLAIGNNGVANFLYAADFANKKIDVFNGTFASVTLAGNFTDPTLPPDYAPFNIQSLGGKLYIAYAQVNPATGENNNGPGLGYISTFDFNGNFLGRLVSNGPLDSPWGMTIAPAGFGAFPGALLVGNFSDEGRINAFNPTTGAFLGTLNDEAGNPIEIDELWALVFGNGASGGDSNKLYFSSGLGEEQHGLFGSLQPSTPALTTVQFSSSNYFVGEDNGVVNITVTRAGDLTGTTTVNYATFDETEPLHASQKSDYTTSVGTLTFSPGQASKTFSVLITNDVYVEGDEVVNLILTNPTGAALGSQQTAELTITDNDNATTQNPNPVYFIASLNGAQEVPSNGTTGKGTGLVQLNANETGAKVSLAFSGLTSAAQAAHIHGPAAPGVNAAVLFPLTVPAATSGSVNEVNISLTPAQVQQLKAGLFYFNIHTTNNPGGEIRGQILFNPIDDPFPFVRQQYFDFLNRYPDAGGYAYWTNQLTQCGANITCINSRRIAVSAAFFIEQEFQNTGFFVYRVRRAALGLQASYAQYLTDRSQVGNGTDAEKTAFAEAFVQRGEFLVKYPTSQNGSDFIDALIATVQSSSGVNLTPRRPELVNEYLLGATQVQSRARVIRKAIEYTEYKNAEINPAFVLAQYFGYLRRDADPVGYAFWLNVLNNGTPPNNYTTMVCAFLTSAEYQQRFGPTITRFNNECQ